MNPCFPWKWLLGESVIFDKKISEDVKTKSFLPLSLRHYVPYEKTLFFGEK
jgi:hypothetical protein